MSAWESQEQNDHKAMRQLLQRLAWHGEQPRIALVSDDPLVTDCVAAYFNHDQVELGIFGSVSLLQEEGERWDCAIVDVTIEVEGLTRLCRYDADLALLGVSGDMPLLRFTAALEAGAVDAVPCPTDADRWCQALIRAGIMHNTCPADPAQEQAVAQRAANEIARWEHLPALNQVGDLMVQEALRRSDNIIARAARLLGVTPQAIHNRLRRSGVTAGEAGETDEEPAHESVG